MNLEIVEFYPERRDDDKGILEGSMRIGLPDLGIQILGVHVKKKGDSCLFRMPDKFMISEVTGKRMYYPVFTFDSNENKIKLMEKLKEKAKEYLCDWVKRPENMPNFLPVELKRSKEPRLPSFKKNTTQVIKTPKLLNQLPDVVNKCYVDLKPLAKKNSLKKQIRIV